MNNNPSYDNSISKKVVSVSQHLILGNLCLVKNNLDRAIEEYEHAVRLDPGYAKAHHSLAKACLLKIKGQPELSGNEKQQLLKRAKKHLDKIAGLFPKSKIP